jgi:collagen type VI alpha
MSESSEYKILRYHYIILDLTFGFIMMTGTRSTTGCAAKNDLLLILDSSGSVSYENFQLIKNNVADLVAPIVSVEGTRVGLMTFSDQATVHMYLDEYDNGTEQVDVIRRLAYTPGTTNTAEALRVAREEVFRNGRDRADARDVIVLFTDGGSNDFAETLEQSVANKMANIYTIVVGVTSWVNMAEINAIATNPTDKNVIMADNFAALGQIISQIEKLVCLGKTTVIPTCLVLAYPHLEHYK